MDILHDLHVASAPAQVFDAASLPRSLDRWWTERSLGDPRYGAEYTFVFGDADWKAVVIECSRPEAIVWEFLEADEDWTGTRFGFRLEPTDSGTRVRFAHRGWRHVNGHYRRTSYCWAQYLRLLKDLVENDHVVPFEERRFG
ncbi:MAG: SRPBCC domain-containing protein [Acidobacteriota bacterium]